ncbi:MAG: potassium channel family protein [Acidimicrobiales bacterium]
MTGTQEEREGRARYGGALALLLVAYVLDAIDRTAIDLIVSLIFIAILSLLLLDPHTPRSLRIIGLFAALASVLSTVLVEALDLSDTYVGISLIANVIVLAVGMAALINRLRHMHQVTISTVMGAVMAYAFIAFLAALLYRGIDLMTDDPFFAQGPVERSDYGYFSFVSLTTLGFGDLTPGTDLAKRLVVIQTFVGQVFLVVAVAQLVSMWAPSRRARQEGGAS